MSTANITIVQQTSPHLRRKDTLAGMMIDVLIALAPVLIYIIVECCIMAASMPSDLTHDPMISFQPIFEILLSVFVFCLTEFVFVLVTNRLPVDGNKHSFKEQFLHGVKAWNINNFLVPCVSGILFALVLPAKTTNPTGYIYFIVVIGALFGSIVGKLVFGGTGHNIFNPAIVGFIFTKECFGSFYGSYLPKYAGEVTTGGTFLGSSYLVKGTAYGSTYNLLDLFLGTGVGEMGTLGETCKLAILIGLAYLLVRRTIDWRVVVSYLGTFLALVAVAGLIVSSQVSSIMFGDFVLYQLLSGGVLFGATYMLTDPVTMPITRPSRVMYGMIAAVATVFIRFFVYGYNYVYEGVAFSILIANMFAPVLDYYKWSTNKYTWKNILAMVLIVGISMGIIGWALTAKVGDLVSSSNAVSSTSGDVSGGGTAGLAIFNPFTNLPL